MSDLFSEQLSGLQEKLVRVQRQVQARAIKEWRNVTENHGDKLDLAKQWLEQKQDAAISLGQRLGDKLNKHLKS